MAIKFSLHISLPLAHHELTLLCDKLYLLQGVRQKYLNLKPPYTPTDNPFVEAFNGHFRQACLDQNWFASLDDARIISETWRKDYNTVRPHTALGHLTPAAFKEKWLQQQRLSENG